VTAIWVGPVFKQISTDKNSYHGYGVQNFLDVDKHFGTKEEYADFVKKAHDLGFYVIQDIICNHAGDIFQYDGNQNPNWSWDDQRSRAQVYPVKGFYDTDHKGTIPFGKVDSSKFPDAAIWPSELQDGNAIFTREGRINNWERDPEYLDGDFATLKDFKLGVNAPEQFVPTPALKALVECYKFWIAYADLDAFRLDTVKHMGWGPTRYFCNAIHEYAMSIGKDNFMIVGEITGGNESKFETVTQTGLNAALGITDLQASLWQLPKGWSNPKVWDKRMSCFIHLH
jgi:glycosidase